MWSIITYRAMYKESMKQIKLRVKSMKGRDKLARRVSEADRCCSLGFVILGGDGDDDVFSDRELSISAWFLFDARYRALRMGWYVSSKRGIPTKDAAAARRVRRIKIHLKPMVCTMKPPDWNILEGRYYGYGKTRRDTRTYDRTQTRTNQRANTVDWHGGPTLFSDEHIAYDTPSYSHWGRTTDAS